MNRLSQQIAGDWRLYEDRVVNETRNAFSTITREDGPTLAPHPDFVRVRLSLRMARLHLEALIDLVDVAERQMTAEVDQ